MERKRATLFNQQEDELLCHVYLEISQDPIDSNNQALKKLWEKNKKYKHDGREAEAAGIGS
ncbi:uncharacterized protein LOC112088513 [Eutrema salsugineum]|uniref:uncharacterized protein LOC112088513 n=1 Tax=Eutrema salsugineum TaxID=72664 RepID=UPI000CED7613|nr:uncharacterized protein LOC112088513 [Eutrema salsugineum]